jgi:hypothetical protein
VLVVSHSDHASREAQATPSAPVEVVARQQCFPKRWTGEASGTLSHDGLTESWSATYSMDRWTDDDPYFAAYGVEGGPEYGEGTLVWQISGTNSNGCTITGGATIEGVGYLSIYSDESLSTYGTEVGRRNLFEFVDVTQDCPSGEPSEIPYTPLNCSDCAEAVSVPYEPGVNQLSGSRSYTASNGEAVEWQWELAAAPDPPPSP